MAKRLGLKDTVDTMYRLCNAASRLRAPLAIALALAAAALMVVALPSATSSSFTRGSAAVTEEPSLDAAVVDRVAPEPRGRPVVVAAAPTPAPTEEPTAAPTAAPTLAPAPVVVAAPVAAPARVAPAAAAPAACPATFFCYPRLGISGAIVAYNDCSGTTDVGSAIRQLTCVRAGIWLAGHAYTQFGGIANYGVGDIVVVRGQSFTITGATVQRACAPTTGAVAPLSLQTSLDASPCGRVLVVQAR
ncbi:MAG TPA: hypothetical protein VM052_00165 [Candidatus Limnocylindrales bacterium]|nr:hypothetical protein [Candidatus Limnocylindrales bacterium]